MEDDHGHSRAVIRPEQFLHPLDVIRSEHDRQLLVCDRLVELAKDFQLEPVAEEAETLLA